MTTIEFAGDHMSIRIPPFVALSEPYTDVVKIRMKSGAQEFHFRDGKTISRWKGLGNFDKVSEIVVQKTNVIPS